MKRGFAGIVQFGKIHMLRPLTKRDVNLQICTLCGADLQKMQHVLTSSACMQSQIQ